MAVPKKKKSKAKKRTHLIVFLDNFKKLANNNNNLVSDILKNKFSNTFLMIKNKNYLELFKKIFF